MYKNVSSIDEPKENGSVFILGNMAVTYQQLIQLGYRRNPDGHWSKSGK